MTRELKLAMVIGFALLLLLAILVSDHFSAADLRQQTLLESSQPRHALASAPPPAIREPPPTTELVVEPRRPTTPSRPADAQSSIPSEVRPLGGGAGRGLADSAAAASAPARSTAPVPTERIHRVAEGESLSRIAERIYGDRELWKALAAYNTDRLPNPNVLKTGLVLRVPPKEVLTGGATAPATTNVAVRDPLAAPASARAHVVREGETLSEIAAATLGSSRRWPELVAANRDRIADPDRVMPGTELRIPAASPQ
jgi:nucleoid-associated protein YgaU